MEIREKPLKVLGPCGDESDVKIIKIKPGNTIIDDDLQYDTS